jgi:hypothetical protein
MCTCYILRARSGWGSALSCLVREVAAVADALGEPLAVLQRSPRTYGRLGFEHSVLCA